jgi:hypothetical protein
MNGRSLHDKRLKKDFYLHAFSYGWCKDGGRSWLDVDRKFSGGILTQNYSFTRSMNELHRSYVSQKAEEKEITSASFNYAEAPVYAKFHRGASLPFYFRYGNENLPQNPDGETVCHK